jgi:hypothetical protein
MGQEGSGFALPLGVLQCGQVRLAWRIVLEKAHGRFRKGPLEISVAGLRACTAGPLPGRLLGVLDQAAIGDTLRPPWEAMESMDFVPQPQVQELADPGDRASQVQGMGIGLLGRFEDGQLHVPEPVVGVTKQR